VKAETPEASAVFDVSGWTVADKASSLSSILAEDVAGAFADDYGYHYGGCLLPRPLQRLPRS
jgi:hypothetical protein